MTCQLRLETQTGFIQTKDRYIELEYAQLLCMLHSRGMSVTLVLCCAPWSVLLILRREEAGKEVCYLELSSKRGKQLGLHSPSTGFSWAQQTSARPGKCPDFIPAIQGSPAQFRQTRDALTFSHSGHLFIHPSIHSRPFLAFLLPRMSQQNGPDCQVCHLPVSQQAEVLSRPFLLPQLTVQMLWREHVRGFPDFG